MNQLKVIIKEDMNLKKMSAIKSRKKKIKK
jgi:hypothetical protein